MTRIHAALIHLAVCLLVALALLALFRFVWYPAPLFQALGGQAIFLLLLGVDVALGPLLTLIVFKQGKKSLKFDLTVIASIQIVALGFGVHALLAGRPVYVVSLGHRFDVIQAYEVDRDELRTAKQTLPLWGPTWVGINRPVNAKERERVMFSALGGADYGHFPKYHAPLASMKEEILQRSRPIAELRQFNSGMEVAIRMWLEERGYKEDEVVFQGLKARSEDMAVVINRKTGDVVGVAPFKPWE